MVEEPTDVVLSRIDLHFKQAEHLQSFGTRGLADVQESGNFGVGSETLALGIVEDLDDARIWERESEDFELELEREFVETREIGL